MMPIAPMTSGTRTCAEFHANCTPAHVMASRNDTVLPTRIVMPLRRPINNAYINVKRRERLQDVHFSDLLLEGRRRLAHAQEYGAEDEGDAAQWEVDVEEPPPIPCVCECTSNRRARGAGLMLGCATVRGRGTYHATAQRLTVNERSAPGKCGIHVPRSNALKLASFRKRYHVRVNDLH